MHLDVPERSHHRQFNYMPHIRGGRSHDSWCQQESVDQIELVGFDFVRSQQVLIHWSFTQACGTFLYVYIAQHWDFYTFLHHSTIKVDKWFRSGNFYGILRCKLMMSPCGSWSTWLLPSLQFVNNFHCLNFCLFIRPQLQLFCGRPVVHSPSLSLSLSLPTATFCPPQS